MKEIWVDVIGYEKIYKISNCGRLLSLKRLGYPERIMKVQINRDGYFKITLCKDGKQKSHLFHRLIAIHFIKNPKNKKTVNHKNGIKTDNRINNLEWNTSSENNTHAIKQGLKEPFTKAVIQIFHNGKEVKHNSIKEASKAVRRTSSNIINVCKGVQQKSAGFKWRYAESF